MRPHATPSSLVLAAGLVALVLAAGPAAAQETDQITVILGDSAPIAPGGEGTVPITVTVDCILLVTAAGDATTTFEATDAPTWATVAFDPAELVFAATDCGGGATTVSKEASALVAADEGATALTPATLEVTATLARASGNVPGVNTTEIQAGFQGALNVSVADTAVSSGPGGVVTTTLSVDNTGNGATMVMFSVAPPTGWNITVNPASLNVAPGSTAEAEVTVTFPADAAMNVDQDLAVSYTSHHATTASAAGPSGAATIAASLVVPVNEDENKTPLPPAVAVGALLVAALVAMARRR